MRLRKKKVTLSCIHCSSNRKECSELDPFLLKSSMLSSCNFWSFRVYKSIEIWPKNRSAPFSLYFQTMNFTKEGKGFSSERSLFVQIIRNLQLKTFVPSVIFADQSALTLRSRNNFYVLLRNCIFFGEVTNQNLNTQGLILTGLELVEF